jgi:hypothetical protein
MPRIFRPGSDIYHAEALGRLVAFQRADDEAEPYADVSDTEAADLFKQGIGCYLDANEDDEPDAPKATRRARRVAG